MPMIIAASPPGLPRKSMTIPSELPQLVDRPLKSRVYQGHPDVEPDHARRPARGRSLLL